MFFESCLAKIRGWFGQDRRCERKRSSAGSWKRHVGFASSRGVGMLWVRRGKLHNPRGERMSTWKAVTPFPCPFKNARDVERLMSFKFQPFPCAPVGSHGGCLMHVYVHSKWRFLLTSVSACGMYLSRRYLWMAWTGEHYRSIHNNSRVLGSDERGSRGGDGRR